jgi:hypothetical protein
MDRLLMVLWTIKIGGGWEDGRGHGYGRKATNGQETAPGRVCMRCVIIQGVVKGDHTPPLCSDDNLDAVGAEELVKGDWPELRILNIRWGGR